LKASHILALEKTNNVGRRVRWACVKVGSPPIIVLVVLPMVVVGGQPFVRSGLYLLFGQGGPTYTLILVVDER